MQTIIQVSCYESRSLRERIVNDKHLADYGLEVSQQRTSGRNPGWAKVHSSDHKAAGAINLEWNGATRTLMARVITRGSSKPDQITGRFVGYLMKRHRSRVRSILILPAVRASS